MKKIKLKSEDILNTYKTLNYLSKKEIGNIDFLFFIMEIKLKINPISEEINNILNKLLKDFNLKTDAFGRFLQNQDKKIIEKYQEKEKELLKKEKEIEIKDLLTKELLEKVINENKDFKISANHLFSLKWLIKK